MKFMKVLSVGPGELKGGVELLRKFSDQDLTLVDAVGLHLMREYRCAFCWSTDRHLGLTGVPLVVN